MYFVIDLYSLLLPLFAVVVVFAHKNNDNSLSAELGSSYTKDDSVNFQLPGFYFSRINREIDLHAEPVTVYVVFSLGGCGTRRKL